MTKGEAKKLMLRWLDDATVNGEPTAEDQIADLLDRADHLLDGAVKFLAGHFKIRAVHSVVRTPIKNLLGDRFDMQPVMPPDVYSRTAQAKSIYVEICGDCEIVISENGSELLSLSVSSPDIFEAVKGNIPDASGDVTVTISSEYPFVVRNMALFPCAFRDDDCVPDYIPYVPYELPCDFREFDRLIQTDDYHEYRKFTDFRKEGLKTFLLPYHAAGQFDFRYFRNPAAIPADAPDDTFIEIDDHAAQLVPLKLAVDCCMGVDELLNVGYYLDNRFNSMLVNLLADETADPMRIEQVYSML